MLRVMGCFDISIMACLERRADQTFGDLISSPLSAVVAASRGEIRRDKVCLKQSALACEPAESHVFVVFYYINEPHWTSSLICSLKSEQMAAGCDSATCEKSVQLHLVVFD